MKTIRLPKPFLPALIASVLLSAAALAQENLPICTNRLIAGNYGFTIRGAKTGGPGPIGPQVGVAMAHFDGEGSFAQTDTVTINGFVVADFTHPPATGTYTVNSDCTGTFNITFTDGRPPVATAFVVVDNGNEIDVVVTSAGGNQGILATGSVGKRVTKRR
jgi:hypothetical protein